MSLRVSTNRSSIVLTAIVVLQRCRELKSQRERRECREVPNLRVRLKKWHSGLGTPFWLCRCANKLVRTRQEKSWLNTQDRSRSLPEHRQASATSWRNVAPRTGSISSSRPTRRKFGTRLASSKLWEL